MYTKHIAPWLLGFASGIANALILFSITDPDADYLSGRSLLFVLYFAGIPYGLITSIYLWRVLGTKLRYAVLWICASAISYVSAIMITASGGNIGPDGIGSLMICGIIGAVILAFTYHFFIQRMNFLRFAIIIGAAGLIPMLPVFLGARDTFATSIIYVVWQTVITGLIMWPVKPESQTVSPHSQGVPVVPPQNLHS